MFVGTSGTLMDVGLLYAASTVFGVDSVVAVAAIQIVVGLYVFLLNKHWSFGEKSPHGKQLVRFIILFGWNYTFGVMSMYVGNKIWGFDPIPVRLVAIALTTSWNFLLYRYWVYR